MAPAAARFRLDEEISLAGRPLRVAGWVQFEDANAQPLTRYLLAEAGGASLVLEESGGSFFLLRPFVPGAQPQALGNTIIVMNEKYTLSAVRKLKVLGTAGQPPAGIPKAQLLVSGLFTGPMGSLLRELAAGASTQAFFSSKPVAAGEVLSGDERAARREAERLAAEVRALAEDDAKQPASGNSIQIAALAVAGILVLLGLVYAYLTNRG